MTNTNTRFLFVSLMVAVLAGMSFTPGLPGEFVFDDIPNIVANKAVHLEQLDTENLIKVASSWQMSGYMRVLPSLSFAIDYWRSGGADPMVFKTTNLVIHVLTTVALAWFFRSVLLIAGIRSERVQWQAPALALAWAAHPLQVSSVLYAVQRIQTMGTLFLVLALWAYVVARKAQVEGHSGRTHLLLTVLLWLVAMGCKEDSVLLPAYTLALELTVLRFAAVDADLAKNLKRGYLVATIAGAAIYMLFVIPHFWHWETLPGRNFSTWERILTQPRMLCLYLQQILIPLPQLMPFYYDWVQPSRSLLQPWTTLPATIVVLSLLGSAWHYRTRAPLFALGIFLFFANHFIASNVVDLELAYEHRNHFALIGAVLAIGSLLAVASQRLGIRVQGQAFICSLLIVFLSIGTLLRAHSWRSTAGIAQAATEGAPGSARAWTQLCASRVAEGGGAIPSNPRLEEAIEICRKGADAAPQSLNSLTLLVALKSLRGDASQQDWDRLQQRARTVVMTHDNARVFTILMFYEHEGANLKKDELMKTLSILGERANLGSFILAAMGYFVMNDLSEPNAAMWYFTRSIEKTSASNPFPWQLAHELREYGRPDLAEKIESIGNAKREAQTLASRRPSR